MMRFSVVVIFVVLFLFFVKEGLHGTGIKRYQAFNTPKDRQPTPAADVRVRGDLLLRMQKAIGYLDQARTADIWDGFTSGMWGGDYAGRTLEAYSRIAISTGTASVRFQEISEGLLSRQAADGSFPIGKANSDFERKAGFWFGNARAMLGLLWAFEYRHDSRYLGAATRLGDYYLLHYFEKDGLGEHGSFGWVATEALTALYHYTNNNKYLDLAISIGKSIPPVFMNSQHTHSYLLSLRGIAQSCMITGDTALLNKVLQQYTVFRERIMWPGGGIVEHLGDRNTNNLDYWYDEGCSVDDWLGLNLDLWTITGQASYMDMVERVALNHLLFDQDEGGGFCGDRSVDFTREGAPWPFCCAMHGTRTLSEITQYIVTTNETELAINLYYPATATVQVGNTRVKTDIQTNYPEEGSIRITLYPTSGRAFDLKMRIPSWSTILGIKLNGSLLKDYAINAGYCSINRKWKAGDQLELVLDMPLRTENRSAFIGNDSQTDMSKVSIWKGPRQLVLNHHLNKSVVQLQPGIPGLQYVYQTHDTLQLDRSVKGTPLQIGNVYYKKGIGVHAVSEIEYLLNGEFKEFRSSIGVDEAAGDNGAVRFKVCVDGLVKTGTLVKAGMGHDSVAGVEAMYGFKVSAATGKDEAQEIRVQLDKAQTLRLVVDDAVNGFSGDYGNWGGARLLTRDGKEIYLSDLPDHRQLLPGLDQVQVQLQETRDPRRPAGTVSLKGRLPGQKQFQPIRFNYLSDLGYSLIVQRPVLQSWISIIPPNTP